MYHDEKPIWRGIFAFDDEETPEWKKALFLGYWNELEGSIPKFATQLECEKFVSTVCWRGSNPDYPNLQHIFSTLLDWTQIESVLIHKIAEYDRLFPFIPPQAFSQMNRISQLHNLITKRLDLSIHKLTTRESSINTLKHAYDYIGHAIFVMIRRSKVVLFVPFANKNHGLCKQRSTCEYTINPTSHHQDTSRQNNESKKERQNCKSVDERQIVNDRYFTQLRDMLEDCCKHRDIPDCEFLINREDHPILKIRQSEKQPIASSTRLQYPSYAPVMSLSTSESHADIPIPSSRDWEVATKLCFPQTFFHSHCDACTCGKSSKCENDWKCFCSGDLTSKKHGIQKNCEESHDIAIQLVSWDRKQKTAFFRGEASMSDTNMDTNPCLHLVNLGDLWKEEAPYNGEMAGDGIPFLDAQLTSERKELAPNFDYFKYKYILHFEGHSTTDYPHLLQSNSVILKVASSSTIRELWYFPLLIPYEDHIPVQSDLSDLAEKIQWCRDNDEKCRDIAACAAQAYEKLVSKSAIHDYIELVCTAIAQRFIPAPKWYNRPQKVILKPQYAAHGTFCATGQNPKYCKRCLELKDEGKSRKRADSRRDRSTRSYHCRDRQKHTRDSATDQREHSLEPEDTLQNAISEHNQVQQCRRCRRPKTVCSCRERR